MICILRSAFSAEEVKDPTGAGDSFAGAFMVILANYDILKLGSY